MDRHHSSPNPLTHHPHAKPAAKLPRAHVAVVEFPLGEKLLPVMASISEYGGRVGTRCPWCGHYSRSRNSEKDDASVPDLVPRFPTSDLGCLPDYSINRRTTSDRRHSCEKEQDTRGEDAF